jgi:dihydrofolate synthase/folylpolyglutamate synthase
MNVSTFSLPEWLYHLENRYAEEIQLGLTRIHTVAKHLNLLNLDATVISVAGTNGKGSTVAALEAIYAAAGYQVASYTSPHLVNFNERIRVNRQPISDEIICTAFTVIEEARGKIHLTYFEMATLAALWHFKQCRLDVIILEVGVGGRLDATNVIDSDIAIITTVDLDHQDYLGDTKDAIGYEKAGILRANKPFIYADTTPPPESVINQAQLLGAPRLAYSIQCSQDALSITPDGLCSESISVPLPKINYKAAAAAIMVSDYLHAILPVSHAHLVGAMKSVSILGRQQLISGIVSTLFDVSHNPQAVTLLADYIKQYPLKGKIRAVFSGLKDKDLHGLIKPMHSSVDFWYPAVLSNKRAASKSLLKTVFQAENCSVVDFFSDPLTAYHAALQDAAPGDLIVVYGSFLTVSAVMAQRIERQQEVVS